MEMEFLQVVTLVSDPHILITKICIKLSIFFKIPQGTALQLTPHKFSDTSTSMLPQMKLKIDKQEPSEFLEEINMSTSSL